MRASPEPCTPSEPSPDDTHDEADCSIRRRSVRVRNYSRRWAQGGESKDGPPPITGPRLGTPVPSEATSSTPVQRHHLALAAVILNLEAWFIGLYPYWSLHYWGIVCTSRHAHNHSDACPRDRIHRLLARWNRAESDEARPTQQPHLGMVLHSNVLSSQSLSFIQHCCVSGPVAGGDPSICGG